MPHIHDLIDNTVSAYIVHKRSVLLIDHKALKKWLPIGGHIELNEDPEEGLFREILEEAGIKASELEVLGEKPRFSSEGTKFLYPPAYLDLHDISATHKHIGMTYFLKSNTDQIRLAEGEHNGIEWVSLQELGDPKFSLSPAVRFYAQEAIHRLGWD